MSNNSTFGKINQWARNSISLKLSVIGLFVLILLIPSEMVQSLIRERETTRNEAISEIWRTWGDRQVLAGPVVSVPVVTVKSLPNGTVETNTRFLHFLPENLTFSGDVVPVIRYRSIYEVVLYSSSLDVKGNFKPLVPKGLNVQPADIKWDKAYVTFGISDMKGVKENIDLAWNDSVFRMQPGVPVHDIIKGGVSYPVVVDPVLDNKFSFKLQLNGSRLLAFLPFASEMNVNLTSSWANPSFEGAFIPSDKNITKQGFTAKWKILELNRNYGQFGFDDFIHSGEENSNDMFTNDRISPDNKAGGFGVNLIMPVDQYQRTTRAAKYGVLFVILTFVTFFFFELLRKKYVHPLQYLIVGFAIMLFYLLLLSFAEYLLFDLAYAISAVVVTLMVMLYAGAIFSNRKYGIIVGLILFMLYAYFYTLLQLQLYSLLFGSIGMAVMLSVIMLLTRNLHKEREMDNIEPEE
ncbi:MAG: cell envelope integrity protein CreD [Lentimicrobiaceae bacterium]|jgi:inner membrane protein